MSASKDVNELGLIMTSSMIAFFTNDSVSDADVGKVLRRLLAKSIDVYSQKHLNDISDDSGLVGIMAQTLEVEFINSNKRRIINIEVSKTRKREWAKRQKLISDSGSAEVVDRLLKMSIDNSQKSNDEIRHRITEHNITEHNISPISPQAGIGGDSEIASVEADAEEAGAPDPVKEAAARMAEAHPRKGGVDSAERALRRTLKKNARGLSAAKLADLVDAIEARHALWLGCPEWQREGGRFAPRLSTWLSGGSWKLAPPEAQKEPPPPADGPKVDCSPETV